MLSCIFLFQFLIEFPFSNFWETEIPTRSALSFSEYLLGTCMISKQSCNFTATVFSWFSPCPKSSMIPSNQASFKCSTDPTYFTCHFREFQHLFTFVDKTWDAKVLKCLFTNCILDSVSKSPLDIHMDSNMLYNISDGKISSIGGFLGKPRWSLLVGMVDRSEERRAQWESGSVMSQI